MFNTYKNQVEAMLMQVDIEDGLGLTNVQFTGRAVLNDARYMYLQTEITDAQDVTTETWVALDDERGLIFADQQPDGLHTAQFPGI